MSTPQPGAETRSTPSAEAPSREIVLGRTEANLIDPPNDGVVIEPEGRQRRWKIGRTGSGNIILRPFFSGHQPHEDFMPDGMSLADFCQWINNHL